MKMLRKILLLPLLALVLAGCNSIVILENDITLVELEDRMAKALDPQGVFAGANSYYQRQTLKHEGIFFDDIYEIQIRYLKPHFLKVTTLKFNQLQRAFIFNGNAAWSIDYRKKTIKNLTGNELLRIKALYHMLSPGSRYSDLFEDIKLDKVELEDKQYYRLICTPDNAKNKLIVYIDCEDFLKKRVEYDFSIEVEGVKRRVKSESVINSYDTIGELLYPLEMVGVTNGVASETVVSEYRLNVELNENEFQVPIFTHEPKNRVKHKKELKKTEK